MRFAVVGLLALGMAAACGGDDSGSDDGPGTTTGSPVRSDGGTATRSDAGPTAQGDAAIALGDAGPATRADAGPTTRADAGPVATTERYDVQLFWQEALDLGSGAAFFYIRLRLFADGTYEKCQYTYASAAGSRTGAAPERSSGSYLIEKSDLTLSPTSGKKEAYVFAFANGQQSAKLGSRTYQVESNRLARGASALCTFR